jgi:hypothetical protein
MFRADKIAWHFLLRTAAGAALLLIITARWPC